jgi:hypothetical protein
MDDLGAIRRMLDAGDPIPPRIVRGLCEQVERAETARDAWTKIGAEAQARYDRLLAAARAWADAIDRCDGIVAAEQALLEAVRAAL